VDREETDHVGALLLGDGFQLRGAHGVLLGHEAHEALDVGPAQLLVRAREARQLAQVRVAATAVPLGEDGQVVVVRADNLLAEPLEGQRRRLSGQAVEALLERLEEPKVDSREPFGHAFLQADEERALRRGAAEQDERVIRGADERRGEHRHERLVVVAVVEQPQVGKQVDHLLLVVVVAAGRAEGR